jgi:hypothetical protein
MSIKMLVPLDALEPRARLLDSTQIVREAPHQGAHVSPRRHGPPAIFREWRPGFG